MTYDEGIQKLAEGIKIHALEHAKAHRLGAETMQADDVIYGVAVALVTLLNAVSPPEAG